MQNVDIIRAWKDKAYRSTLTPEELASLPAHPAGPVPLPDESLDFVGGSCTQYTCLLTCLPSPQSTWGCCGSCGDTAGCDTAC